MLDVDLLVAALAVAVRKCLADCRTSTLRLWSISNAASMSE